MKKKMKRFLSLLLCLVMVLGLIPAVIPTAEAADDDQVRITSWKELMEYLTDPAETRKAYLYNDISHYVDDGTDSSKSPTVTVVGEKHLRLRGCDIIVDDDSNRSGDGSLPYGSEQLNRTLFVIDEDAKLTIVDEGGSLTGVVRYDGYMADDDSEYHVCWRNLFDVYGTLIIDGGLFEAGRELKQFFPFVNTFYQYIFGKVITTHPGASVEINDGTFIGYGYVPASSNANCNPEALRACVIQVATEEDKKDYSNNFKVNPATILINGGEFYGKGGADIFSANALDATSDRADGTQEQLAVGGKNRISVAAGYFQTDKRDNVRIETNGVTPQKAAGSRGVLQITCDSITNRANDSKLKIKNPNYDDNLEYVSDFDTDTINGLLRSSSTESVDIRPVSEVSRGEMIRINHSANGEQTNRTALYHELLKLQAFTDEQADPNRTFVTMIDSTTEVDAETGVSFTQDLMYYEHLDSRDVKMKQAYKWEIWKGSAVDGDPNHVVVTENKMLDLQKARDTNGDLIDWNSDVEWVGRVTLMELHPSGERITKFYHSNYNRTFKIYLSGFQTILNAKPTPTDEVIQIPQGSDFIFDVDLLPFPDAKDAWRGTFGRLKRTEPTILHYFNISLPFNTNWLELGLYEFEIEVCVRSKYDGSSKDVEKLHYKFEIVEGPAALPSGAVVYVTSGQIDNPVILGFTEVLKNLYQQNPEYFSFQWQVLKDSFGWADITGATDIQFTPSADNSVAVGDKIRVKVSVEGYEGFAVSAPLTVKLKTNPTTPPKPKLDYEPYSKTVFFAADNACEYVWSRAPITQSEEFEAAKAEGHTVPVAYGAGSFYVSEFGMYYVAARYAATEDSTPGSQIVCAPIWCESPTGESIAVKYVRYPELAASGLTAKVYLAKGETKTIRYAYDPYEANTSEPAYFVPNINGIATIEKESYYELEITGNQPGIISVYPAMKSTDRTDTWSTEYRRAQSLSVVVYDPANPAYDVLKRVEFPSYTVALGSVLAVDNPTAWNLDYAAADLESKFTEFRWYMVKSEGTEYSLITENEYASIDPMTGTLTPKKVTATPIQVEVLALKPADAAKIDAGTMIPTAAAGIGWYKVNIVETSGDIKLEQVSIVPNALDLVVGETCQLNTRLFPANAYTTDDVQWRSGDTSIVTVDSSGMVKAVASGTTFVRVYYTTVAGATVDDKIQIKVRTSDHNHVVETWSISGENHVGTCVICKEEQTAAHNHMLATVNKEATCNTAGEELHVCAVCKAQKTVNVPATGKHSYYGMACDDDCHWNVCTTCGKEKPDSKIGHTYDRGDAGQFLDDYGCQGCGYSGPGGFGVGGGAGIAMEGFYYLGANNAITAVLDITYDYEGTVTIVVAQYTSAGRMKAVKTFDQTGGAEVIKENLFTHADGDTYRAFMVKPTAWTPLCKADLSAPKG